MPTISICNAMVWLHLFGIKSATPTFPNACWKFILKTFFFFLLAFGTTSMCFFFFFIAIGSRPTWGVLLSPDSMPHPPEKSFFEFPKKSIHPYHLRSPIFSKNSISMLTLRWSSLTPKRVPFLFKVLPISKLFFLSVGRFSYKNIKLLN